MDAHDAEAGGGAFQLCCGFAEVRKVTYRATKLISFRKVVQDGCA